MWSGRARRFWKQFQFEGPCHPQFMPRRQVHTERLYTCSVEAEDPHGYAGGRYFPVKLGDVFEHGRYRILHKLGWGGHATVWLAKDIQTDFNVALKFSNTQLNGREHQILRHLRTSKVAQEHVSHPGRKMILELLDDFAVSSTHQCLVLNIMGESLQSGIDVEKCRRLPRTAAQSIARHIALGLDYLWKCGVAHGDLYSGNVLFSTSAIARLSETQILERLGSPRVGAIKRPDGLTHDSAVPPYLVAPAIIPKNGTEVKIIDFGNAFFHDAPPTRLSTPWHVRAPEALFNHSIDKQVDMWSMGCLFFELITGRTLIDSYLADRASVIDGLKSILGSPSAEYVCSLESKTHQTNTRITPRTSSFARYFELNYNHDDSELIGEEEEIQVEEYEKPQQEFSAEELNELCSIIKRLLNYEPSSRGSTEDLLNAIHGFENS